MIKKIIKKITLLLIISCIVLVTLFSVIAYMSDYKMYKQTFDKTQLKKIAMHYIEEDAHICDCCIFAMVQQLPDGSYKISGDGFFKTSINNLDVYEKKNFSVRVTDTNLLLKLDKYYSTEGDES